MIKFREFLKEQELISEKSGKIRVSSISTLFDYAKEYSKAYYGYFNSTKNATGKDKEKLVDLIAMLDYFIFNRRGRIFDIAGEKESAEDIRDELIEKNKKIKINEKVKINGRDVGFNNLYNEVAENFIKYEGYSRSDYMPNIVHSPERMHDFNKEMLKINDYFQENIKLASKNTEYPGTKKDVAIIYSLYDSLKEKGIVNKYATFVNGEGEKFPSFEKNDEGEWDEVKKIFLGDIKDKMIKTEKIFFDTSINRVVIENIKTDYGIITVELNKIELAISNYYLNNVIYG